MRFISHLVGAVMLISGSAQAAIYGFQVTGFNDYAISVGQDNPDLYANNYRLNIPDDIVASGFAFQDEFVGPPPANRITGTTSRGNFAGDDNTAYVHASLVFDLDGNIVLGGVDIRSLVDEELTLGFGGIFQSVYTSDSGPCTSASDSACIATGSFFLVPEPNMLAEPVSMLILATGFLGSLWMRRGGSPLPVKPEDIAPGL